jgi:putative component of membrane protein insertase Oxa1/YidC/SpoIIIJ protein YidD
MDRVRCRCQPSCSDFNARVENRTGNLKSPGNE